MIAAARRSSQRVFWRVSSSPVDPAAVLPLRVDDVSLEVVGEAGDTVTIRLVVFEGDAVCDVKEQELSWAALELADRGELEARVRHRLARADPRALMPSELLRRPCPYRPVGPFDAPTPRHWVQAVVNAIREQAHARGFDARFECLEDWPAEAAHAYYLWHAEAMLGGNGLESFLLQAPLEEVIGVLAALEAAGCQRFTARAREGLRLAIAEGASEFQLQADDDWLDEHRDGERGTWSTIDHWREGGTYWLIEHELRPALAEFVRARRELLLVS